MHFLNAFPGNNNNLLFPKRGLDTMFGWQPSFHNGKSNLGQGISFKKIFVN